MSTKRTLRLVGGAAGVCLAATTLGSTAAQATNTDQRTAVELQRLSLRVAANPSQAADVFGNSTADGAKVVDWDWKGQTNQLWQPDAVSDGYYRFTNVNSGKCLNVVNGSSDNGAQVVQYTCGSDDNELWRPIRVGNGYQLQVKSSGKCLNVRGNAAVGNQLIQYTCSNNGANNDVWLLSWEPGL